MIERDGHRVVAVMDGFALGRRHASLYGTIVACHLFDGFDINMTGFVLPSIGGEFHLVPAELGYLASSVFIGVLFRRRHRWPLWPQRNMRKQQASFSYLVPECDDTLSSTLAV